MKHYAKHSTWLRAASLYLWIFVALLTSANTSAMAATLYVSPDGNDSSQGTLAAPFATVEKAVSVAVVGDSILLKRGGNWDETVSLQLDGNATNHLTLGAYGAGEPPIIFGLNIGGNHAVVRELIVDHRGETGDALTVRSAVNVSLIELEIRNGSKDGIDVDKADGLLVDSCEIHHFLAGSYANQVDAHGFVATDSSDIVIRNVEIHHVSGDSIQTDPDRDTNTPDNILIEDSHLWTGPLQSNFNQWNAGEVPGENAIDTKMVKSNWDAVPRMRITIRNVTAHGWMPGYISNRAAFNLKEKIEAVLDGVTVFDNEQAFRIRGTRGNANVTIMNSVVFDNDKAVRAEDNLANLNIYNSTFGNARINHFQIVAGDNSASWDLGNNAFLNDLPTVAVNDSSNLLAFNDDFSDPDTGAFHLLPNSPLIDQGDTIGLVQTDIEGTPRPQGNGYDVGAYEYVQGTGNTPPSARFGYGCAALTCSFTDNSIDSDGSITAWFWDFGDGATSSSPNPSHNFAGAGSYPVSLRVTDNDGSTDVTVQSVTVNTSPPPPPPPANGIDFNAYPLSAFANQDLQGSATIEDGGATLWLAGNTWKRIDFPYAVTPQTVLEFDFQATGPEGTIHGIGLEDNNKLTSGFIFKLFGTRNCCISTFDNYPGEGWVHYRIPVGQYYTRNMLYLVFAMDDDRGVGAASRFRNVRVYDE